MSTKSKGINAERELVHMFNNNRWVCIRAAGSGSSQFPSPDLLAGNSIRKLALECKITKETSKYFPDEEIQQLQEFSKIFGAEPWLAVKFHKSDWFFILIEDLEKTGKGYSISLEKAKLKGLLFSEVIK